MVKEIEPNLKIITQTVESVNFHKIFFLVTMMHSHGEFSALEIDKFKKENFEGILKPFIILIYRVIVQRVSCPLKNEWEKSLFN